MVQENQTMSIPAMFERACRAYGEQPLLLSDDGPLSFLDLERLSRRFAAALQARGVLSGERIALLSGNCAQFVVAYLGILRAGAAVLPLNVLLNPREMAYILTDAGATGLCYHPVLGAAVEALRSDVALDLYVAMGEPVTAADCEWGEWLANDGALQSVSIDPERDLAALLYTSGTTGHPKGAMLSHQNLVSNTCSVVEALQLRPGADRLLVVLPMFHAFAATVGMLTPMLHGLTLVPVPRFDPEQVTAVIARHGATVFLGVPSMYNLLLRLGDDAAAPLRELRYCVSGGAALPNELRERFEQRFSVPVYEGDGPTECSPVTCVNPVGGPRRGGSVGVPIPGVEMCIMDDAGQPYADGEVGEICVRGPSVMMGYWRQPGQTQEAFFQDWFRTGDLGYREADGYFYMVDRKKDLIITNGMNVYPRVVEEVLYRHPEIREAAVVGEPHSLHGEVPVAYVVADVGVDGAAVRAYCREFLGRHEVPRRVYLVAELPKSATGKILKRALRRDGELERGIDQPGPLSES